MRGSLACLAAMLTASALLVAAFSAASAQARRTDAPPNDNRADALAIGFPITVPGTLVGATVERLDPQKSQCGTIDSTVWYRVDKAPDGTISVSVHGAGLAPVLRVYNVTKTGIAELDCATAKASGTANVAWQTTRGNSYLILVGKKTGTADAAFELSAQLFLPPANDSARQATKIGVHGNVRATTLGATRDDSDPDSCSLAGGTVWYSVAPGKAARVVLRLHAEGDLDASAVVLEKVRSQTNELGCVRTDRNGDGILAWDVDKGARYLVVVGQQRGSSPGDFTLRALAAQPREVAPGKVLRGGSVGSRVDWLTDVNDVWWTTFRPGTTYRIAFSSSGCAALSVQGKGGLRRSFECNGYMTFTPGPDAGGRYVFEITAPARVGSVSYRLKVAPAAPDDVGVGIELENLSTVRGTLAPNRGDVVDIYHFDVSSLSDVRVQLAGGGGASITLLTYGGARLGSSSGEVERVLGPGHYVAAVRGSLGAGASSYRLMLVVRRVTHTSLSVASTQITPGSAAVFTVGVDPAPGGGRVRVEIERFDPLAGWQFFRIVNLPRAGTLSWTPPAPGRWRARASYLGTVEFSPSTSGYATILVARPLAG